MAKDGSQLFNTAYGGILDLDDWECMLVLEEYGDDLNLWLCPSQRRVVIFDTTGLGMSNPDTSNPDFSLPERDFRQDDFLSLKETDR